MKSALKLIALGGMLVLVQVLFRTSLPAALSPDLVLIFAAAMGLRTTGTLGLWVACAIGMLVDVLSSSPSGLFALICATACAVTRALDGALYVRAPGPWAAYMAAMTVASILLMGLCLSWFRPGAAVTWAELLVTVPGRAVTTGICGALLLPILLLADADPSRDPGLGLIAGNGRS